MEQLTNGITKVVDYLRNIVHYLSHDLVNDIGEWLSFLNYIPPWAQYTFMACMVALTAYGIYWIIKNRKEWKRVYIT